MTRTAIRFTISLAAIFLSAPPALARTIRVPADYPTIQAAIGAAQDGDKILVSAGRYIETLDFLGKKILVQSVDGPDLTIVDANSMGSVVTFVSGEGDSSVLNGFQITGGSGTWQKLNGGGPFLVGGGIYCKGASPRIKNCHLVDNNGSGFAGRAVFCGRGAAPRITGCVLRHDNNGSSLLFATGKSRPSLVNNQISNCKVATLFELWHESGIHFEGNLVSGNESTCFDTARNEGSDLVIVNNVFMANTSCDSLFWLPKVASLQFNGNLVEATQLINPWWGLIFVHEAKSVCIQGNRIVHNVGLPLNLNSASLSVSGNIISGNRALEGSPGALVASHCDGIFENNTITGNDGFGAIWLFSCTSTLRGNVISGNTGFAGLWADCGDDLLIDNLIVGNSSPYYGGGIFVCNGALTLANNTIALNRSEKEGGGIAVQDASVTLTDCIVWQNEATEGCPEIWEQTSQLTVNYSDVRGGWPGAGNLDVNPLFVDPTIDYRLDASSPCIDAASDRVVRGRDLDGNPRFLDGDLDGELRLDMGAYEFSHVGWKVAGDLSPGGLAEIQATGTAGLQVFLCAGQHGDGVLLSPFGELFVDLTRPWTVLHLGSLPLSALISVPPGLSGTSLQTQLLATDVSGSRGNFSNPVSLRFE